mgnify:CR=1 FL=1
MFCFTLGAMQGVFLSNDLYTTFIFFEVMSFASYPMVIHNETKEAIDGSNSYLGFAVLGSLVSLMGLFMLQSILGTLQIDQLVEAASHVTNHALLYTAGALTLVGFGVKAGMYPLHTWLPQAHSVAPAPASAMLSAVITKAGIFGIIVVSCNIFLHDAQWGLAIVIFGTLSMVTGAVLAVFSNKADALAKEVVKDYFGTQYFTIVRGQMTGVAPKPAAEGTNALLQALHADPASTLYVGDSNVDVETAHNANLPCCGAVWGIPHAGGTECGRGGIPGRKQR